MRASTRGCRGARARAVARLGAMASAASGRGTRRSCGRLAGCARGVNECASALREHDEGEPERGHAKHATVEHRCTTTFRERRSTASAGKTRIGRALRLPKCQGKDGRGRCVTQLTQGHGVVDGDELAATKWSSEFLARFRPRGRRKQGTSRNSSLGAP